MVCLHDDLLPCLGPPPRYTPVDGLAGCTLCVDTPVCWWHRCYSFVDGVEGVEGVSIQGPEVIYHTDQASCCFHQVINLHNYVSMKPLLLQACSAVLDVHLEPASVTLLGCCCHMLHLRESEPQVVPERAEKFL